jgi:hypothetical protein
LLVLSLLVVSFVGYGAWTRSQPTHYSRGGDAFAATGLPGAQSSPGTKTSPGADHGRPAGAKKHTSPTSVTGGTTGRHVSTGGGPVSSGQSSSGGHTGSTPPPSDGGPVWNTPRSGSYTLAVSGKEHVRFGPFSACTNTFPSRSQLVVRPASGEPAGSYDFDLRFYPSSANRHDERHIYRYTSSGMFLSFEQATVTCGGVKQSSSVSYSPTQQRAPLPLSVGATWHDHGGDNARTEDGTGKVVGTANLTVGGHTYRTYVIDSHLNMTGDETGSRDQRWWYSPDIGMPLKWTESLSGKRSGATYSEDVTVTVVATP